MSLLLLLGGGNEIKGLSIVVNSFGEQSQNVILCGIGVDAMQPVRLDLSPGAQQLQNLLQRLCQGDPFASLQLSENKLIDDKRRIQEIVNVIASSGVLRVQNLLHRLCEGDPFSLLQILESKLADDKRGIQEILNTVSGSIEAIQPILQSLSHGDVGSLQKLLIEILEKDIVTGQQKVSQSLEDIAVTFPAYIENDILLDGISIKNEITELIISYREDSVHNSIEINSANCDLFWRCNPIAAEGSSRIEVQIGSRRIYFLVEKRSGDEHSFSFWGRSLSAREDTPYAEDLSYSLENPKSAKNASEDILMISSLNWECEDWILPASFTFEGPPLEGVTQIAAAIGAVVRCEDDGTICVRQRFPVRPVDMDGADAVINYSRKNLTELDHDYIKGPHYNAIEIIGRTVDVNLPDISVEESSPEIGKDVHLRVYWAGKKPSGIIEMYVTDGKMTLLGEETKEEKEAEMISFEEGIASVLLPITSITSVEWLGDYGGDVTYQQYSKDLEIAEEAYRIAKIKYTTTYSRYRLDSHYVEMLLALLIFGGESDVSVEVKIGQGDKPAPEFRQPLLTSENIAVVVGTAWLDANRYDQKRATLETPYNEKAIDGKLVYINDAEIDCVGNFHVESCNIILKGPKIVNELGVVQCQV